MSSLLAELVRKQTGASLVGVFSRTVDKVVEELAHDLLQDTEFRKEMQTLIRAAFKQALQEFITDGDH